MDRDCRVLMGRGHESEAILPFGPWVDACRTGEVGPDEEAVAALSPAWRAELSRLLPDVATPGLPPPSDSDLRLFESVAQLVEQLAARRPLVLLLEDLHWADEMSLRLLAFVSRRVRGWAATGAGERAGRRARGSRAGATDPGRAGPAARHGAAGPGAPVAPGHHRSRAGAGAGRDRGGRPGAPGRARVGGERGEPLRGHRDRPRAAGGRDPARVRRTCPCRGACASWSSGAWSG